ncbi:MAG: phosphate/phosphite/phosphonate ABC transporter substrate-binding protein [Trueperaceae bacterium]|nr:phosphate/phosphite/phosphonate ABC transporter substrate-binding protein [Trueperaceae bacterium]
MFKSTATTRRLAATLMALLLALVFQAASAQGCERGALDARFCDTDGDLLADPPTNASQYRNPSTLVFTYAPTEDPAVYQEAFGDFIAHLSALVGRPVQYFPVQSYAAQVEAMRAGRLHVAGFAAGAVEEGVNLGGFHPVAVMAAADGSFGYEMEIIVPPGSDIRSLEDLKGRQLAFVSPTSNSGYSAPAALLYAQLEMRPNVDYQTAFSGSHDNSILGVVNGDYEAAAIASSVMDRMIARGVLAETDVEIIYTSQTFPSTAYGYVYDLEPELAAKVREAFLTFDWAGTTVKEEFADSDQFLEIDYKRDWEVLRQISAASSAIE